MTTRHIDHDGFPPRKDDHVSFIHHLTRTRLGVVLFMFYTIGVMVIPLPFVLISALLILRFRLMKHIHLRHFFDWVVGRWLFLMAYSMELLLGVKSKMFGHQVDFDDHCIFIMNHRCHFDWLFFFPVVAKQGQLNYWTVMQKLASKYAPFYGKLKSLLYPLILSTYYTHIIFNTILGWCMQVRNHFFLTRQWKIDEKELKLKLQYMQQTQSCYQMLLFPEGTDLTPRSKLKSDKFAEDCGLPKYEYCLQPRSTGFVYTLNALRKYKIDSIYDITVGYPDIFAKTEIDLFTKGRIPREIHYHIVKYQVSDLPNSEDDLKLWLKDRWDEKEKRLKQFYIDREFREMPWDEKLNGLQSGTRARRHSEVVRDVKWGELLFCATFYFLLSFFLCYFIHWFPVTGTLICIIGYILCIYYCYFTEGLDMYMLECFKKETISVQD